MITFNDLTYFETIIRLQSITAAAEELYVSQQALSASIAKMESSLNTVLLTRSPSGVVPTKTGVLVNQIAQNILASLEELNSLAAHSDINTISICYMPQLIFHEILIHKTKQLFLEKWPQITLEITAFDNFKNIHLNDYTFICYNTRIMNKSDYNAIKQLRNFKTIPFCTDCYCLVFNKTNVLHNKVKQPFHIQKLLTLNYSTNEFRTKNQFHSQLHTCGYFLEGEVEDKKNLEEILSLMVINPEYTALVPKMALQRYSDVYSDICSMFEVRELPPPFLINHVIACHKTKMRKYPYIIDFLNLFLEQAKIFTL